MKKLTMAVAVAVALFGSVTAARAESGALIGGGRLALNYSTLAHGSSNSTYTYTTRGGYGLDVGAIGRYAVVEGQMGINAGLNFIYRIPYSYSYSIYSFSDSFSATDMAVAVPVLFEISAATFGLRTSSIYELVFLQIGLQADYVVAYSEDQNGTSVTDSKLQIFDRKKFGIGVVAGAVGYFNSHLSLDVRYYYSFINFDTNPLNKNWYPYSVNIGLSFYL